MIFNASTSQCSTGSFQPKAVETDNGTEYCIAMTVPTGVLPGDIIIELDEVFNILTIASTGKGNSLPFEQQFVIPNLSEVSVTLGNGVLNLIIPKSEQGQLPTHRNIEAMGSKQQENLKTIELLRQQCQALSRKRMEAEDAADEATEYNLSLGNDQEEVEDDNSLIDCSLDKAFAMSSTAPSSEPSTFRSKQQQQTTGVFTNGPILSPALVSPCKPTRANSYKLLKSKLQSLDREMKQEHASTPMDSSTPSKRYQELQEQREECDAALKQTDGWQLLQKMQKLQVAE